MTDTEYRIEHDTMGEVRVPRDALYAAQTTLDAKAKNIQVVITNSGHKPMAR